MVPTKNFINSSNGTPLVLKGYINCKIKCVNYGLQCTCPLLYISQTTKQLKQQVQKHLSTITLAAQDRMQKKKLTTVAEHFLDFHRGKPTGLKVFGFEQVFNNGRGGDTIPLLLRKESRWIYEMNTLTPNGLNAELVFSGFL